MTVGAWRRAAGRVTHTSKGKQFTWAGLRLGVEDAAEGGPQGADAQRWIAQDHISD